MFSFLYVVSVSFSSLFVLVLILLLLLLVLFPLLFRRSTFQMNFVQISKIDNNINAKEEEEDGNYTVDRILNNNNNGSDINESDLVSSFRRAIDCGMKLTYNADGHPLNSANQPVDLAQMEYNVKQFLLKQNEWSPKESCPTTQTQSSISSVSASHSYC